MVRWFGRIRPVGVVPPALAVAGTVGTVTTPAGEATARHAEAATGLSGVAGPDCEAATRPLPQPATPVLVRPIAMLRAATRARMPHWTGGHDRWFQRNRLMRLGERSRRRPK